MRLLKGNKIIPVFPCGMLKKIKHEKGDIGSMKIVLDVSGEEKESLLGFLDAKKIPYTASFPMACQFFTMEDARSAITDEIAKRGENYQKVADYYDEDSIAKKILAILQGRVQDGFGFDTDALQQVTGEVLYACHNSISELLAYRKRIEGLPVSEAEQKEIEGFILYQGYPGLFRIRPFVMRVYEDVARSLIPSLAACLQQVTENKTFSRLPFSMTASFIREVTCTACFLSRRKSTRSGITPLRPFPISPRRPGRRRQGKPISSSIIS